MSRLPKNGSPGRDACTDDRHDLSSESYPARPYERGTNEAEGDNPD